ncbi:hypothetical protein [Haloterrigena alkaliphila]|uniref:Uncharacterized protein n=1 Tax=Haloterrigena alkaliphila TaxID=2816475 RepID=A0A8A2VEY4_9EURY|nr:hypothetical protein [Haloterrigena alkaliphila]QSX00664.1 hypothetical protein J0X25_06820 [Haloterrigena alkaliphila]
MNSHHLRTVVIVILLGVTLPLGGCLGGGSEYTVSTEQPTTGNVFGEVVETEIHEDWSHYVTVEVTYSINETWVDSSGNVTGPNGTWSERPEIAQVELIDGTAEVSWKDYLRPNDGRWQGEFLLGDSETHSFQLRAVVGDEILDTVNVTVQKT